MLQINQIFSSTSSFSKPGITLLQIPSAQFYLASALQNYAIQKNAKPSRKILTITTQIPNQENQISVAPSLSSKIDLSDVILSRIKKQLQHGLVLIFENISHLVRIFRYEAVHSLLNELLGIKMSVLCFVEPSLLKREEYFRLETFISSKIQVQETKVRVAEGADRELIFKLKTLSLKIKQRSEIEIAVGTLRLKNSEVKLTIQKYDPKNDPFVVKEEKEEEEKKQKIELEESQAPSSSFKLEMSAEEKQARDKESLPYHTNLIKLEDEDLEEFEDVDDDLDF